jgi:hypothetical protein
MTQNPKVSRFAFQGTIRCLNQATSSLLTKRQGKQLVVWSRVGSGALKLGIDRA